MPRLRNAALLGATLIASIAMPTTALLAAEVKVGATFHDKQHNDDHQWNTHEDRAYGMWVKENHRKNTRFVKLKEPDQQAYWGWRHEHSDALLKINIR